ncbi:MAG: alpha/beta hydrolase fold domain-containing protein [Herbiconiux sp.]|nr:alpha/beta hydrolase fold domain-containing protein [Herbiconiux sp.]
MTRVMRMLDPVLRVRRSFVSPPRSASEIEAGLRSRPEPEPARLPASLRRLCTVREQRVEGRRVITLTPRRGSTGVELIHAHGGYYVHPLVAPHWAFLEALIRASGVTVTVPLYGLAPEHAGEEALPFLSAVYLGVRDRAGAHPVFLSGDSAGGGLAVAQALRFARGGLPAPQGLILIAPWLDVTMTDPDIVAMEKVDPMLDVTRARVSGRLWAGGRDPRDPEVSPLFASRSALAGLPPVRIVQGGRDLLLPDVRRFARRLREAGVDEVTRIYPDGFHVFVGVPALPESRSALAWIAAFLVP